MSEDATHKNIIVEIEHNPTGARRIWHSDMEWHDSSEFFWSEGNFACDCNRGLVWLWAVREDEADDETGYPCHGNVFRIVSIKDPSGQLLYEEEQECSHPAPLSSS